MKTIYSDIYQITKLQENIVRYVDYWVHVEKTPISQKEIMDEMMKRKVSKNTLYKSIYSLVKLGYLREAITNGRGEDGKGSEKRKYIQLRRI